MLKETGWLRERFETQLSNIIIQNNHVCGCCLLFTPNSKLLPQVLSFQLFQHLLYT